MGRRVAMMMLVLACPACFTRAQGVNIDLGPVGSTTPVPDYAGAAGQPGFWNPRSGGMRGLDGLPTSITFGNASGQSGTLAVPGASAGDAALMEDSVYGGQSSYPALMSFQGMRAGTYRLTVYCWNRGSSSNYFRIGGTYFSIGSMPAWPGHQVLGGTYVTEEFIIASASDQIQVELIGLPAGENWISAAVQGMQLVQIPGPGPGAMVVVGCLVAQRRRR